MLGAGVPVVSYHAPCHIIIAGNLLLLPFAGGAHEGWMDVACFLPNLDALSGTW